MKSIRNITAPVTSGAVLRNFPPPKKQTQAMCLLLQTKMTIPVTISGLAGESEKLNFFSLPGGNFKAG